MQSGWKGQFWKINCCCSGMSCKNSSRKRSKFSQKTFGLILGGAGLFTLNYPAMADVTVTLGWRSSGEANVAGYKVYYGPESRNYDHCVDAGNSTNVCITVPVAGVTNYFATTAYDTDGNESDFSEESTFVATLATGGDTTNTVTQLNQLTSATLSSGTFSFTVNGISGAAYVIQASTNLTDWFPVQTNTAPFVFEDAEVSARSQCFYRALPL
jgi:hypothetical protein